MIAVQCLFFLMNAVHVFSLFVCCEMLSFLVYITTDNNLTNTVILYICVVIILFLMVLMYYFVECSVASWGRVDEFEEIAVVRGLLNKQLLPSIKVMTDWLAANPDIIATCVEVNYS